MGELRRCYDCGTRIEDDPPWTGARPPQRDWFLVGEARSRERERRRLERKRRAARLRREREEATHMDIERYVALREGEIRARLRAQA